MIPRLRAWLGLDVAYCDVDAARLRQAEEWTAREQASCVTKHAAPDYRAWWRMAEDKARRRTLRRVK